MLRKLFPVVERHGVALAFVGVQSLRYRRRYARRMFARHLGCQNVARLTFFSSRQDSSCQPQPPARKPAWLRGVASRTLARLPDKNGDQRGEKGHKMPEREG